MNMLFVIIGCYRPDHLKRVLESVRHARKHSNGKMKITFQAREIAFTFKNYSSKEVSSKLVKDGIATRNDNFYAWRCLKSLGIDINDGVVRTSMVHYNSREDVDKLINSLKKI